MIHRLRQGLGLITGLTAVLAAQAQPGQSLANLYQTSDAVTQRASSFDPDWDAGGNADARPIQPGETLVLADLEGPGLITHIWITIAAQDPQYSRLLALRMYWDDETDPSVEAPIGDFFAMGHGIDREVDSAVVAVTSEGRARNCYWPMPFRKRARIEVTNEGSLPVNAFYYYVDWEQVPSLPANTAYFHAMYRQEYPARFDKRYLYADIEGEGHYVGTVHSARARTPGWIGEGDDFFHIDGETEPRLKGTGTEDYYSDAWGFREMNRPYYGAPLYEGEKTGDRTTVYRWHIADPIRFKTSLFAEIEHVGPNGLAPDGSFAPAYGVRMDDIASVAFWYQTEPHKPWTPMPVGAARLYPEGLDDLHFAADAYRPYVDLMLGMTMSAVDGGAVSIDTDNVNTDIGFAIENPTSRPATVSVTFDEADSAETALATPPVDIPPGGRILTHLRLPKVDLANPGALQPIPLRATYRFQGDGPEPIEYTQRRIAMFDLDLPIERTRNAKIVDGALSDWPSLPFVMTRPAQIQFNAAAWEGPDDGSFRFGVVYTDEYVYIGVDVTDDRLDLRPGDFPWLQDGVEIRVAAGPQDERNASTGQGEFEDVLLFAMSPGPEGGEPAVFQRYALPEGALVACRATDTGFAAEVAIPMRLLIEKQGVDWDGLRLNIAVDDRDGGELTQLWWRPDWRTPQTAAGSGRFTRVP